ncbi:MAG: PIG-L deacetylase family protein [Alphaproteobacteria bacterium]
MSAGAAILAILAAGGSVADRVMIVVAHPDDETIGLGAQLSRFKDALLVHVTDGAPRDGHDSRNYGFVSVADYAAAREAELAAALRAGDAARLRRLGLGIPDKEAWQDLAGLARCIAELLRETQPACVFTHAYEGGHPDHDSTAFAVHAARRLTPAPPTIIEIPYYHRDDGRLVTGEFLPQLSPPLTASSRRKPGSIPHPFERPTSESWPEFILGPAEGRTRGPGRQFSPATVISLRVEERDRKQHMIDCFATQLWLLEQFDLSTERFRVAPDYDFREPPHPGELHYETLGWGIVGADWRCAAADALQLLGLSPSPHCEERSGGATAQDRARLLRSARNNG